MRGEGLVGGVWCWLRVSKWERLVWFGLVWFGDLNSYEQNLKSSSSMMMIHHPSSLITSVKF